MFQTTNFLVTTSIVAYLQANEEDFGISMLRLRPLVGQSLLIAEAGPSIVIPGKTACSYLAIRLNHLPKPW